MGDMCVVHEAREQKLRECEDAFEGFDEFWKGMTQALGFTGHVEDLDENSSGADALFKCQGQFDANWDVWEEIGELLCDDEFQELVDDAMGFLFMCREAGENGESGLWTDVCEDMNQAGVDFHFTRNGHGAGFWDGDWEHGDKLSEFAKTFGTCEMEGVWAENEDGDQVLDRVWLTH